MRFSWDTWRRRHDKAARRAFADVPHYRERWERDGVGLRAATPAPTAVLAADLPRLVPFSRPWSPADEPALTTGNAAALAGALRIAGLLTFRRPVIEARAALVDWSFVGHARHGAIHVTMLRPDADVVSPERRHALNEQARRVAATPGGCLLVCEPDAMAQLAAELTADGAAADVLRVERLTPAAAVAAAGADAVLVHDPVLGYLGGRASCGLVHLDHERVFAEVVDGALVVSVDASRRPALLAAVPDDADGLAVGACSTHGTPVLTRA